VRVLLLRRRLKQLRELLLLELWLLEGHHLE
jgi:hypothetical protein